MEIFYRERPKAPNQSSNSQSHPSQIPSAVNRSRETSRSGADTTTGRRREQHSSGRPSNANWQNNWRQAPTKRRSSHANGNGNRNRGPVVGRMARGMSLDPRKKLPKQPSEKYAPRPKVSPKPPKDSAKEAKIPKQGGGAPRNTAASSTLAEFAHTYCHNIRHTRFIVFAAFCIAALSGISLSDAFLLT